MIWNWIQHLQQCQTVQQSIYAEADIVKASQFNSKINILHDK